ncbi:MAG TPA: hypothetical protein VKV03_00170 [Candidatus Binataceae bacterium]|nr:hypothetical protein [Candidatus Binataceae bacterium]
MNPKATRIDLRKLASEGKDLVDAMASELEGGRREEPPSTEQHWPTRFISAGVKVAPPRWTTRFVASGLKTAPPRWTTRFLAAGPKAAPVRD